MPNGDVTQYAKSNPTANRMRLVGPFIVFCNPFNLLTNDFQFSEATSGVVYLHELKVVHGDLKAVSVVLVHASRFTDD